VSTVEMERPLPQSVDAERAVLAAILLDNKSIDTARTNLRPEDFFLPQNRQLFTLLLKLADSGTPVDDLILVTERAASDGILERVGGAPYIASLVDGVPKVSNVAHYARIVKEKSTLRNIIHVVHSVQQNAYGQDAGSEAILADADTRIQFLRSNSTTAPIMFHKISELAAGEPEAIIDGYFEEGLSFLGAKSGVGKTWLGIAEGKAIRTGEPFLGVFPVPRPRNLLYLIPEMTARRFRSRCEKLGIDIDDPGFLVRTMKRWRAPAPQRSGVVALG
jgi:replicative DNA helicase